MPLPADAVPPPVAALPPAIVVTASRTGTGAATDTTVVDRDAIERRQPATLLEVLDGLAGVRAASTGGIGGTSFLSIEGGEPNFTLVLLEGIKLNNPTNSRGGAFDLAQIDPGAIEAVEVARGPLSAVHGSDALAGVVNLRLREPPREGFLSSARLTGDSRGALGGSATGGIGWGGGGMLVSAGAFDSGNLEAGSDLRRMQGLARVRQTVGAADLSLLGLWAHSRRSTFAEDSGGPALAVNRARETSRDWLGAAAFRASLDAGGGWRPEAAVSWSRQSAHTITPAIAPGRLPGVPAITARDGFERLEATSTLSYAGSGFNAVVGAGALDERGRSEGTLSIGFPLPVRFAQHRTTLAGFAEATARPVPALTLNAAARYDGVEGGGGHWTGRGAATFRPASHGPALFGRVANGYKLPSFYALGHPLIGNPALRPERSRRVEAGGLIEGAGHSLRLAWFENRFRDLIDFDPVLFRTVNRDRVRASGLEGEGRAELGRGFALAGSVTRLALASPTPLRGRPRWFGAGEVRWRGPRFGADLRLRFNGDYFDSSIPSGLVQRGGRTTVDLGLEARLTRNLSLRLNLLNATHSRTGEAVGFPAPGRTLRLSIAAASF